MQQDNDRKHSGKKNLAVAEAQSHTQPDVKRDVHKQKPANLTGLKRCKSHTENSYLMLLLLKVELQTTESWDAPHF